MELSKYVYFCVQKSIIKAGNNKFQDFINVPRIMVNYLVIIVKRQTKHKTNILNVNEKLPVSPVHLTKDNI